MFSCVSQITSVSSKSCKSSFSGYSLLTPTVKMPTSVDLNVFFCCDLCLSFSLRRRCTLGFAACTESLGRGAGYSADHRRHNITSLNWIKCGADVCRNCSNNLTPHTTFYRPLYKCTYKAPSCFLSRSVTQSDSERDQRNFTAACVRACVWLRRAFYKRFSQPMSCVNHVDVVVTRAAAVPL